MAAARAGRPTRAPTRANSRGPTATSRRRAESSQSRLASDPVTRSTGPALTPRSTAQTDAPVACAGPRPTERGGQVVAEVGGEREQAHDPGELERRDPLSFGTSTNAASVRIASDSAITTMPTGTERQGSRRCRPASDREHDECHRPGGYPRRGAGREADDEGERGEPAGAQRLVVDRVAMSGVVTARIRGE